MTPFLDRPLPTIPWVIQWPLLTGVLFVAIASCGAGCYRAPSGDQWLDGQVHQAKAKDAPIDVYYDPSGLKHPTKAICLLRIRGTVDDGGIILHKMRKEARQYGADAVVFTQRGAYGSGGGVGLPNGFSASHEGSGDVIEAVGVIYTDGSVPPVLEFGSAETGGAK